jgi:hypothetical protein
MGVLLVGAIPHLAHSFSAGPPDGYANEPPGFQNCTACHGGNDLNSGDGSLTIDGLPALFVPGVTYDLSVVLEDPGQERWGFELTVLDAALQQAGTLTVTDAVRTQLSDNAGTDPDYLKHTSEGTDLGVPNGPTVWEFQWTAADVAAVTLYVTGNGADNNFGSSGDYIYAVTFELEQDTGTPVIAKSWSAIKEQYR